MEQTISSKLPAIGQYRRFKEEYTDSSGISLTGVTDNTSYRLSSPKNRLRYIAQLHKTFPGSEKTITRHATADEQSTTPFLPRIQTKESSARKDAAMKCEYRFSSLSKVHDSLPILSIPKTVGKYRDGVKVVPVPRLPSPESTHASSSHRIARFILKEQYIKERNQPSPGFTEADLARIFDRYSIARYLKSYDDKDSRYEPLSRNTVLPNQKTLSSVHHLHQLGQVQVASDKPKITWIPRLSAWVADSQGQVPKYFKLNSEAKLTVKTHPFCSHYHDYYHNNLHWDILDRRPFICSRFSHHHDIKHHENRPIPPSTLVKNANKRKHLTLPRDPFTSKDQRTIKRPWLKAPSQAKAKIPALSLEEPSINLVLHNEEKDDPYQWMVDNATMTEDSLSDVYSLPASIYTHSSSLVPSDVTQNPVQTKKKKVRMVDQACDAMSESSIIGSPGDSCYTDDLESIEVDRTTSTKNEISNVLIKETSPLPKIAPEAVLQNEDALNTVKDDLSIEKEDFNDSAVEVDSLDSENFKIAKPEAIPDSEEEIVESNDALNEATVSMLSTPNKVENDEILITDEGSTAGSFELGEESKTDQISISDLKSKSPSPIQSKLRSKPPPPKFRSLPKIPPINLCSSSQTEDEKSDITAFSEVSLKKRPTIVVPLPTFNDRPGSSRSSRSGRSRISIHTPSTTSSQKSAKRRGKVIKDMALAEEMRRMKQAEERRKRAHEKFQKMKEARSVPSPASPYIQNESAEDDGFLAKFCILNPNKMDYYKRTFDSMDVSGDGLLDCRQMMEAVLKILPNDGLTESDIHYIYRLLELADYNVFAGKSDFKLFSIVVSLAQRIASLDDFMKGIVDRFDFESIDVKMWKARQLFYHLMDNHERQTMSLDSLWLELKACGLTQKHENQVRNSLKHLKDINIMDFMTYLPLFALAHSEVVNNPLSDERVI